MADPRLNSVHLPSPRREEFRSAREALLHARGEETLNLDRQAQAGADKYQTAIQNLGGPVTGTARYVLVDKDYIHPLKVGLNTVGRLPDNDVVINDPYISRRHCAILVHAHDGCELHDIASKNGTLVNGRPLTGPTRLTSGDEIQMCDRQLVFLMRDDAQAEPGSQVTLME